MIFFFQSSPEKIYALESSQTLPDQDIEKLNWLFGGSHLIDQSNISGKYVGPRKEMITPWSTNAVEITLNMGITGVSRIEEFHLTDANTTVDPMLQSVYPELGQEIFHIDILPEPVRSIDNIGEYSISEGLALSGEEIEYLENISKELGRPLTDSEVFGFSQVNSEHCRHKIFNGTFIIDGKTKENTLFQLIKKTSSEHPNYIVSAYKDNVAFVNGPNAQQFAPKTQDAADFFTKIG